MCDGAFLPIISSRIGVVEQCSAILLTELPFAIKPEIYAKTSFQGASPECLSIFENK